MNAATLDSTSATFAPGSEVAALRDLYQTWIDAFTARDYDRLMALYDPEVRVFDAIPPYETRGAAAYRTIWEQCLPGFPEGFEVIVHGQEITVSGDLAFITTLYRMTGMEEYGDVGRSYLRSTYCLRKRDGRWLIVHEHTSVPFDPYTLTPAFILEDFKND